MSCDLPLPRKEEGSKAHHISINDLTLLQAAMIGSAQALALIPGISRSGVTMVACLRSRLNHEDALRFTFLLATPVILAAGLLKMPELFAHGVSHTTQLAAFIGGGVAAVAAYLSVRFLTRYFHTREYTGGTSCAYCLSLSQSFV
jgi:undecaprenyl-diphosphatase